MKKLAPITKEVVFHPLSGALIKKLFAMLRGEQMEAERKSEVEAFPIVSSYYEGYAYAMKHAYRVLMGIEFKAIYDDIESDEIMTHVHNKYGVYIDYALAESMMDADIRERIHAKYSPCTKQKFFDLYCKLHKDEFGETFELDKESPNC